MTDYSPEYNKEQLTEMITGKLQRNFGCTVETANNNHMFKACALVLRDIMSGRTRAHALNIWSEVASSTSFPKLRRSLPVMRSANCSFVYSAMI